MPLISRLTRILPGQKEESSDGKTKGGLTSKIHLAVDAHGLPIRLKITHGTTEDCTQAPDLIRELNADALMADRAFDTNDILDCLNERGIEGAIPSKKNRTERRSYYKFLYRLRHIVEHTSLNLINGAEWLQDTIKTLFLSSPQHSSELPSCGLK